MKNTLFAIGEALIDFIPNERNCGFSEVKSFSPKTGGAPANVLGAFSKLGGKTQLITQLGDDPFGHKIADELKAFNIGLDNVVFTKAANTALAFVSLDGEGNRTFSFYRNPSADMLYSADNLSESVFEDCFALHFCSVSLGDFPMKGAHRKAIELAKKNGAIISFDPNIRLPLWNDTDLLKSAIDEFLPMADIIKVSDEEIGFITGYCILQKLFYAPAVQRAHMRIRTNRKYMFRQKKFRQKIPPAPEMRLSAHFCTVCITAKNAWRR